MVRTDYDDDKTGKKNPRQARDFLEFFQLMQAECLMLVFL